MTAYKYVERKAEDQINWAEVGKNFSNTLQEEVRVRQEKKAAIDEASREYQRVLDNTPQGEFGLANTFALDGAAKLQKQALMQNTLLKSGQLDPRRYTIMQQNLVDGTDQMFSLAETYQSEYQRKMKLMADGTPPGEKLSGLEANLMASVEGLGNLENHEMTIDPNTGMIGVGRYNSDGVLTNSTTAFALKNRLKSNTKEFDMVGASEKWLNTLGTNKTAEFKNLGNKLTADVLLKISDITAKVSPSGNMSGLSDKALAEMSAATGVEIADLKTLTLYKEAQMNYVKSQLSPDASGTNAASMLFDHVGGYDTYIIGEGDNTQEAWDKMSEDDKKNKILVKTKNGNPEFVLSDEQVEVAERAFQSQIDIGLDYSEEEEAVYRQREGKKDGWEPEYVGKNNKADEEKVADVSQWMNIRSEQDPVKREVLVNAILQDPKSVDAGLKDIRFSTNAEGKTTLEVEYANSQLNRTGENAIIISEKGKVPTQEQWALAGVTIHGVSDPNKIMKAAGGYSTDADDFDSKYKDPTGIGAKKDDQPLTPSQAVDLAYKTMQQQFVAANIKGLTDDDVQAPALAKIGKPYGIIVTDGVNTVTITKPGEDPKKFPQDSVEAMMTYMLTDINSGLAQKAANPTKQKRTIQQIMTEDGVDRVEATKRFKAQ